MFRFAAFGLVVLLAVAVGCRKKSQPVESNPNAPESGNTQKPDTTGKPNPAVDTLRARGAQIVDAYFKTEGPIVNASLHGPKFGDDEVALLRSMTSLKSVSLSGSKVTDSGLAALGGLSEVHTLFLNDTAIGDAGMIHVGKMRGLQTLYIEGTQVTDAGLQSLKGLANLSMVQARRTRITDAGVARLKGPNSKPVVGLDTKYFEFTSPDGRFSVVFPWTKPEEGSRGRKTPFGQITSASYESKSGMTTATVEVADFTTPQLANVSLEQVVNEGVGALAREIPATVKSDARSTSGNLVIRDVVLEVPGRNGQGPIYFKYVIHGRRLYTVAIMSEAGAVPEAEKNRFLGSFKVLK